LLPFFFAGGGPNTITDKIMPKFAAVAGRWRFPDGYMKTGTLFRASSSFVMMYLK
jgi:hypothetical protein